MDNQAAAQNFLGTPCDRRKLSRDHGEFRPLLASEAMHLFGESGAELRERAIVEEPLLHGAKHADLDLTPLLLRVMVHVPRSRALKQVSSSLGDSLPPKSSRTPARLKTRARNDRGEATVRRRLR